MLFIGQYATTLVTFFIVNFFYLAFYRRHPLSFSELSPSSPLGIFTHFVISAQLITFILTFHCLLLMPGLYTVTISPSDQRERFLVRALPQPDFIRASLELAVQP